MRNHKDEDDDNGIWKQDISLKGKEKRRYSAHINIKKTFCYKKWHMGKGYYCREATWSFFYLPYQLGSILKVENWFQGSESFALRVDVILKGLSLNK